MPTLIDWHAHHTAPELESILTSLGGKPPRADPYDSPDFARRVGEMDEAEIGVQLICQGAGVDGDRFDRAGAVRVMQASNDVLAERVAAHAGRLFGLVAISLRNPDDSAQEIERRAGEGFRGVLFYARGALVTRPEAEPIFAAAEAAGLPIFLHGGGGNATPDPSLELLEDRGQGVVVSAHADAAVTDCVVRMIAAGIFDRHPGQQVVIRSSGGGVPLLLNKLYWKHRTDAGEQRYADVLRDHFLVDTASASARTLQFLIDTMGEDRVVFGSDYCGGLGPLTKGVRAIDEHPDPTYVKTITERNSRRLLRL